MDNPPVEQSEHYNVMHTGLQELDLKPHLLSNTLTESMFDIAREHRSACST